MNQNIPSQIVNYFKPANFVNYPYVSIPQEYSDNRGVIKNIADGQIGDVAIIISNKNTLRANHYHKRDWHLSYLVEGQMSYFWRDSDLENWNEVKVGPNDLIYTPAGCHHKMIFLQDTIFVAISALSRISTDYELDTVRLA